MNTEYRLKKGARTALNVVGVLLCILIVTIPIGILIFFRVAAARVSLSPQGVKAKGAFGSTSFDYSDVARLGLLKVALAKGQGVAGELAKSRVGGDEATHIIVKTKADKVRSFMVSSYENSEEIINEVGKRLAMPYETVTAGAGGVFNAKWP